MGTAGPDTEPKAVHYAESRFEWLVEGEEIMLQFSASSSIAGIVIHKFSHTFTLGQWQVTKLNVVDHYSRDQLASAGARIYKTGRSITAQQLQKAKADAEETRELTWNYEHDIDF
jgi:hypothetical protein